MSQISVLIEAKKEYTIQLQKILTQRIYEGFKQIYIDSYNIAVNEYNENNSQSASVIKMFQKMLKNIPQWNQEIINKETDRIIKMSNCDYLDSLIETIFISNAKILTSVQLNNDNNITINIPSTHHFIHKCYIECAKEIYKNPYVIDDKTNLTPKEKHRNLRDAIVIIEKGINNTIRILLPIGDILRHSLIQKDNINFTKDSNENYNNNDIDDEDMENDMDNDTDNDMDNDTDDDNDGNEDDEIDDEEDITEDTTKNKTEEKIDNNNNEITNINADMVTSNVADVNTSNIADVNTSNVADVNTSNVADVNTSNIADVNAVHNPESIPSGIKTDLMIPNKIDEIEIDINEISSLSDNDILDKLNDDADEVEEVVKVVNNEPLIKQIYLDSNSRVNPINMSPKINIPVFNTVNKIDPPKQNIQQIIKHQSILDNISKNEFLHKTDLPRQSSGILNSPPVHKTVVQEQYTPIINKSLDSKHKIIRVIKRNKDKGSLLRTTDKHILIKDAPEYESDEDML